jgi:hypothetical protein
MMPLYYSESLVRCATSTEASQGTPRAPAPPAHAWATPQALRLRPIPPSSRPRSLSASTRTLNCLEFPRGALLPSLGLNCPLPPAALSSGLDSLRVTSRHARRCSPCLCPLSGAGMRRPGGGGWPAQCLVRAAPDHLLSTLQAALLCLFRKQFHDCWRSALRRHGSPHLHFWHHWYGNLLLCGRPR